MVHKSLEIISEDEKSYTVIKDGKEVKLFKIDTDKIKMDHTADLYEASRHISNRNLDETLYFVNNLIKNPPNILDYEASADGVSGLLKRIEFDLKPHNLNHLVNSLIKNIDLNCYGKAQTFMDQLSLLRDDLIVISAFREEMVGN